MAVFLCSGSSSSSQFFLCKFSVLFLGFRRDVREFLGGILGLQGHGVSRPAGPCGCVCAVAAAAANFLQVFCSVSRVSDVTLESFWVGFSYSFVLQGHGVLLFRNRPLGLCCGAVLRAFLCSSSSSSSSGSSSSSNQKWIGLD